MLSSAACSFFAKALMGTLRDVGKIATVFKLVLFRPRLVLRDVSAEEFGVKLGFPESTSWRTRDAIMLSSLKGCELFYSA